MLPSLFFRPAGKIAYRCLLLVALTSSCEPKQDLTCTQDCTVLQGQLTTDGGREPLARVPLEVVYFQSPGFSFFGGLERTKAQGYTNAQGRYEFRLHLLDEELQVGKLLIRYTVDQATFFVRESSQPAIYPNFYGPPRRNTIVTTDLDVPRSAWLRPQVSGSPGPGDYFNSFFLYPDRFRILSQHRNWFSPEAATLVNIPGGLPIIITTTKIKGGVQTQTVDTLRVPGGQTLLYEARF